MLNPISAKISLEIVDFIPKKTLKKVVKKLSSVSQIQQFNTLAARKV
jgi:hypothetical protein